MNHDDFDGDSNHVQPGQDIQSKVCQTLMSIRTDCIEPKLRDCYQDPGDFRPHLEYLLSNLKIEGNLLATHFSNVTDVPSCEVFADTLNYTLPISGKINEFLKKTLKKATFFVGPSPVVVAAVSVSATVVLFVLLIVAACIALVVRCTL